MVCHFVFCLSLTLLRCVANLSKTAIPGQLAQCTKRASSLLILMGTTSGPDMLIREVQGTSPRPTTLLTHQLFPHHLFCKIRHLHLASTSICHQNRYSLHLIIHLSLRCLFYEIRWDFWNNGSLVPCSLVALVMSLLYRLHLMNLASCLHKWPCCQAVQFGTTISLAVGSKSRYSLTLWSEPLDLPVVALGAEEQETRISPCSAIGVGSFP